MVSFACATSLACYIILSSIATAIAINLSHDLQESEQCQQTSVLILGAGTAGITAAQALHNNSISDFIILEYNNGIGGRIRHTEFGQKPNGNGSYTVELGANWVQGLGSPGGPENPIWTLAKRYDLANTFSNYSNLSTFDQNGPADFGRFFDDYEDAYSLLEQDAGEILRNDYLDRSARAGFRLSGWDSTADPKRASIEWWDWDWEDSFSPEETSELFGTAGYNLTFYQYSEENNFVYDSRGYNAFLVGEAATFLLPSDPRLQLNTVVTNISYSDDNVTAYTGNGTCVTAQHAICTFSLGVLQAAHAGFAPVSFSPSLPKWKQAAIAGFDMGIYTKIFLQFPTTFWDPSTQFFLYASPTTRGYFPLFQSLSTEGFLPGSNILFVTVVTPQSRIVEAQDDATTQAQVMEVLYQMFGRQNVPDPVAFMYPRWGGVEWAYGSYSNWPTGVTIQQHQNLRANIERLWFAGEHTSAEYFGFVHGAWFEGQEVGTQIAKCLLGESAACKGETNYEVLFGTQAGAFNPLNGWDVSSLEDNEEQ